MFTGWLFHANDFIMRPILLIICVLYLFSPNFDFTWCYTHLFRVLGRLVRSTILDRRWTDTWCKHTSSWYDNDNDMRVLLNQRCMRLPQYLLSAWQVWWSFKASPTTHTHFVFVRTQIMKIILRVDELMGNWAKSCITFMRSAYIYETDKT